MMIIINIIIITILIINILIPIWRAIPNVIVGQGLLYNGLSPQHQYVTAASTTTTTTPTTIISHHIIISICTLDPSSVSHQSHHRWMDHVQTFVDYHTSIFISLSLLLFHHHHHHYHQHHQSYPPPPSSLPASASS